MNVLSWVKLLSLSFNGASKTSSKQNSPSHSGFDESGVICSDGTRAHTPLQLPLLLLIHSTSAPAAAMISITFCCALA